MTILRRTFVGALAALLLASLAPVGRADGNRQMLVRVEVESATQAAYLMSYFDETHNHSDGEIELLLWPGDRARLDAMGAEYEVVVEDLFARDSAQGTATAVAQRLPGPDLDDYRRLADYNDELKKLATANPHLVKLFKMKRLSLEGREVFGVEIAAGVNDTDDGRPVFYIDALHHAREWPASEYTQIFVHYLVEGYGKDPRITSLLRKTRVIAVPIVNVDGFDYSREAVLSYHQALRDGASPMGQGPVGLEGYWRKNRRSFTDLTVVPIQKNPDAYGVDPNRNYAYLWGDNQGGSSGYVFYNTYRGEAPFSEPETRNVRDIILGRPVTGVVTNHTYQASVLRAGGGQAPDDAILERIGQKMADILDYNNQATVGYPTTGTTEDWAYAATGVFGYTIEHGRDGFHPAYDREVGAFWKQHMDAFMIAAEMAANPDYHSVLKGRVAGGNARLTITKTFKTPLSPGNPFGKNAITEKLEMTIRTGPDGTFEWHVTPSSRPFEKKTESYTLTIVVDGERVTKEIVVDRGGVLDLGTIRI